MKNEVDADESVTANGDRVIQAEKESPKLEPTVQPRTVVNDVSPIWGINRLTTNGGHRPEVIRTIQVRRIRICVTDRSRKW